MSTTIAQAQPQVKTNSPVIGEFGSGRYSALMEECYEDAMAIFKLSEPVADKLAREIASDFGAAMAKAVVNVKRVKAANKEGKVTLSEASKVKGVHMTYALSVLAAMGFANEAGKYGIIRNTTEWEPVTWMKDYFQKLEDSLASKVEKAPTT